MIRLLICGGRHYTNYALIRQAVIDLGGKEAIEIVIEGDQWGADKLGGRAGDELGIPVQPEPAEWKKFGNNAGPIRNQAMIDKWHPTYFLAFPDPGSRGTWDMVHRAEYHRIPGKIYYPDGTLSIREAGGKVSVSTWQKS